MLAHGRAVRHRDIIAAGFPAAILSRMVARGEIERVTTLEEVCVGYRIPSPANEVNFVDQQVAAIALRHPNGVFCLTSALRLHDLFDDRVADFTIALPPNRNRSVRVPNLKTLTWSDPVMMTTGIETREVDGTIVKVTDPARTVVDLFRPMHKVTDEVAFGALEELVVRRGGGLEEIARIECYAEKLGQLGNVKQQTTMLRRTMPWLGQTRQP